MKKTIEAHNVDNYLALGYDTERHLMSDIDIIWRRVRERFLASAQENSSEYELRTSENEAINSQDLVISIIEGMGIETVRVLPPQTETFKIKMPGETKAVFLLEKALRKSILGGLGLAIAFISPISVAALLYSWAGYTIYDVVKEVLNCYIKVEDEIEKLVFGAVWQLQNEYVIIDYDALKAQDYNTAYGKTFPTLEKIHEALGGKINEDELKSILIDLKEKRVLVDNDHRWGVPFW